MNNYSAVLSNKKEIDKVIELAIDDGVNSLVELDSNNNLTINKDAAIQGFFMSLYSSFGIFSDKQAQEKLNLYIPVIAITSEDGYHILYSDEYVGSDGKTYTTKRWSEKFPYYYEDEDFIYSFTLGDVVTLFDKNSLLNTNYLTDEQRVYKLNYHDLISYPEYMSFRSGHLDSFLLNEDKYNEYKRVVIANCLESSMSYYSSHHNDIASRHGITYNFAMPTMSKDSWAFYLNVPSMFILFQGYPYGEGSTYIYNRVASAGSRIVKNEYYLIEQKGWYKLYHLKDCEELNKPGVIIPEDMDFPFYDEKSCVEVGAYACPTCIKNGVYPPDYNP